MKNTGNFYINGAWVAPLSTATQAVINPATEAPITSIAMGNAADAARAAGLRSGGVFFMVSYVS